MPRELAGLRTGLLPRRSGRLRALRAVRLRGDKPWSRANFDQKIVMTVVGAFVITFAGLVLATVVLAIRDAVA